MYHSLDFPIKNIASHFSLPGRDGSDELTPPYVILPTFQRDVVWKSRQICELWDSLMRGIPLPSLILSKVGGSGEAVMAKIRHANTEVKAASLPQPEDFWLLDGQQRAVAILCGFGRREHQRLWLDLAWPPGDDEKQNHGRRFGFFLCTRARPWGDNRTLDGRPGSGDVRIARAAIDKAKPLNGCFDFEIDLKKTWPVAATAPIPFTPLIEWALKESTLTVESLHQQILEIIETRCPQSMSGDYKSVMQNDKHSKKLNNLLRGLNRLRETSIQAVVADIDVDDLLTAFTRLNRNGTQVNEDELFYAALKREWPESQKLVAQASLEAQAFGELDVLHGFTVLASQELTDRGKHLEETSLTPAFMQTLKRVDRPNFDRPNFEEKIKDYLLSNTAQRLLQATRKVLRYQDDDDPGLPVVMLPRLRVRTWLPVLHWIEHSGKLPPQSAATPALTREERYALLRYVLTDHFFADWDPDGSALLRELLDVVGENARQGCSFPDAATLIERLTRHKKVNSDNNSAWLKVVSISLSLTEKRDFSLPLSRKEMDERFRLHYRCYRWALENDGQIWLRGRRQDLLMWSQREALDKWFGDFLHDIAMLGEAGRPWDYDHIVPQDFFNNYKADTRDIRAALAEIHHHDLAGEDWNAVRHWRGSTGNYRVWPLGFNRKDGDMPAYDKLIQKGKLDSHVVLSQWWNKQQDSDALEDFHPLANASAVDLAAQRWEATPRKKQKWVKNELVAFMEAVRRREQTLYGALLDFIWPGFAGTRSINRLATTTNGTPE